MSPGPRPSSRRHSRRRSPCRTAPGREGWLRSLSTLLAVVARGERLAPDDRSSMGRRLRQQLELGQRLLDPLPAPLHSVRWQEEVLWKALRWGGAGLLLGWWLTR